MKSISSSPQQIRVYSYARKRSPTNFFYVDDLLVAVDVDEYEERFLKRFTNSTAHTPDTLLGMDLTIEQDAVKFPQEKLIHKG